MIFVTFYIDLCSFICYNNIRVMIIMRSLCNKYKSNKGFTLLEMLIVVAIIAILVSIGVPAFSSHLERSREATDIANMRSARSAIQTAYMTGDLEPGIDHIYYYNGSLSETRPADLSYGRGTRTDGKSYFYGNTRCPGCNYEASQTYNNSYLIAYISIDGQQHVHWASADLNFAPASLELPGEWKKWGRTDSRGVGGNPQREKVLQEMGLSENHEYAIEYTQNSPVVDVYIYNGNFPSATRNRAELEGFLGGEYKDFNVTHYQYNESTKETTLVGLEELRAGIRPNGSSYFIQLKAAEKWT